MTTSYIVSIIYHSKSAVIAAQNIYLRQDVCDLYIRNKPKWAINHKLIWDASTNPGQQTEKEKVAIE